MVEKTAADYAKIFRSVQLEREIDPICANIEDMLARLDEFESLLSNVKAETSGVMENCVRGLNAFGDEFQALRQRIDKLEAFVNIVTTNLDTMEQAVDIAEEELNVTDYSLKGLILKPLLNKTNKHDEQGIARSNLKDGVYQEIPIFKTTDYFGTSDDAAASEIIKNNDNN